MYVFRQNQSSPKVLLSAFGSQQGFGVDYDATYAPVVKHISIRLIPSTAAILYLGQHQMDVVTAFLLGELTDTINMHISDGIESSNQSKPVCRLIKSWHGLKQAHAFGKQK